MTFKPCINNIGATAIVLARMSRIHIGKQVQAARLFSGIPSVERLPA